MKYELIKDELLKKHAEVKVTNYINYLTQLETAKNSKGQISNAWFNFKKEKQLIDYYNKVDNIGLCLDGDTVTIQSRGIVYDFNAYKNLVLIRYPETKFDIQLVRDGDEFSFCKKDGKVFYSHKLNSPFEEKNIIGAYCIIKNKLGEFIETMSLEEIEKIRKTAKTDYIWKQWFSEMCLKSVIKRACKRHFKDIVVDIEEEDNKNYDMENPLDIELKTKQEIEEISTLEDLKTYYLENVEKVEFKKSFNTLITKRKQELSSDNS